MTTFFKGEVLEKKILQALDLYLRVQKGKERALSSLSTELSPYIRSLDVQRVSRENVQKLTGVFITQKIQRFIIDERRLFSVLTAELFTTGSPLDTALKSLDQIIPLLSQTKTGKEMAKRLQILKGIVQYFNTNAARMLARLALQEEYVAKPTSQNVKQILLLWQQDINDKEQVARLVKGQNATFISLYDKAPLAYALSVLTSGTAAAVAVIPGGVAIAVLSGVVSLASLVLLKIACVTVDELAIQRQVVQKIFETYERI